MASRFTAVVVGAAEEVFCRRAMVPFRLGVYERLVARRKDGGFFHSRNRKTLRRLRWKRPEEHVGALRATSRLSREFRYTDLTGGQPL